MTSAKHPHRDIHASSPDPDTSPPRKIYQILAGRIFDSVERSLVPNQVITIDSDAGIILDVSPQTETRRRDDILKRLTQSLAATASASDSKQQQHPLSAQGSPTQKLIEVTKINLGHLTVLPGFVDVHVHFFLHPYSETSWDDQLLKESLAERTVRATNHARKTLLAGFTTVRDLGTEGAFDADIGLRKCLSGPKPIIPGPRYYCATRAIISTGSYGPRSSLYPAQDGIDGVIGARPVDGVDECVKEVRRQIGAGADWIKIYADYRCRARQADVSSPISTKSISTFTRPELQAMVDAAHLRGVKVAAHANTAPAISHLLDVGIDSIEHGPGLFDPSTCDRSLIRKFIRNRERTTWVPTLAAFYTSWVNAGGSSLPSDAYPSTTWENCHLAFEEVVTKHAMQFDNIAVGGDTGVFAHGENALEMVLMRRYGASWERVLGWATLGGWKCVRGREWEGEEDDDWMREGGDPTRKKDAWLEGVFEWERKRAEKMRVQGGLLDAEVERKGLDRGVPFGAIRAGWAADLVGIEGKLDGSEKEFETALFRGVNFVMKSGTVYKMDGFEVISAR